MCLMVFANNYHPDYKLIFAANRDEFYERPSHIANFWNDHSELLAGRDLKEGGTWCGITKGGRFAAITNYREIKSIKKNVLSRGKIVTDYLLGNSPPELFAEGLSDSSDKYNGYSLVFGDESNLFFFSNQTGTPEKILPGIHALSNHLIDTPWFNVRRGKELLEETINRNENIVEDLFALLADKNKSPDNELPKTGLDKKIEKEISSIFVDTPGYGTRSSTVILIDKNHKVTFIEKALDTKTSEWITNKYEFGLFR